MDNPIKLVPPKKLPRGIQIRKNKLSESLQVCFTYQGIQCRETLNIPPTNANINRAMNKLAAIKHDIEFGVFNYVDHFPNSRRAQLFGHTNSKIQMSKLFDSFILRAELEVEASTLRGYKSVIRAHLKPEFGLIQVKDLSPQRIRQWITNLKLTQKSIRNILSPLRVILDRAVNDDLIAENPLDRVKPKELIKINSRESTHKIDPLNPEEISDLLNSADGQIKNLFQFAIFSGLRTSELIALTWDDIDFESGTATINKALVQGKTKPPKTKSGNRKLQLTAPAIEALLAQKKFTYFMKENVFHSPKTKKPWTSDAQIRKTAWQPLVRKAGISYRNPYQTRHTFASMMISSGENVWWVSSQMGHRNIEMILKHYGKWIPQDHNQPDYTPRNISMKFKSGVQES